jgi:PAS domain S-box-containing protein
VPRPLLQLAPHPRVGRKLAVFVLVSTGPLALLTWCSGSLSTRAVQGQGEARVSNTATASTVWVDQQLDSLGRAGRLRRPVVGPGRRGPAAPPTARPRHDRGPLAQRQQTRPAIAVALVAEPHGRLVDVGPVTPATVGQDFRVRDWSREATATGQPCVSAAEQSAATGRARVVAATVQLRGASTGGRPGRDPEVLVAAYSLDTIQGLVEAFAAAQGVRLTGTDQRGVLVAAPGAAPAGWPSHGRDRLVAAALGERSATAEPTTPAGRVRSAAAPARGIGWTVADDLAADPALASAGWPRDTVLAIAAVLGLILLAALVLLARSRRQRARAERRLRASQERTQAILEAASEAFISMDAHGMVTGWNAQAARTFGWSRAEAVGQKVAELIIPDPSRDAHEQGRRRYLATGEGPVLHRRLELSALHRDGHQFPVEIIIWPVGSGEQTSFNAFAHDISQRQRAEAALRASQERLGLALDAANMGYWDHDLQSGKLVCSPQLEELFGLDPGSLDGGWEAFQQRAHPDDQQAVQRWAEGAAVGGTAGELQFRVLGPDGEPRWLHAWARVHRDGTGRPVRMVGVAVDNTERRRGEQAVDQAKQQADRANRAKSEFLSRMSHELRTPLNAILGFGQLLRLDDLTEGQRESVDQILRGGRHLLGLINEVLEISRIETGSLAISSEAVNVAELLTETLELIRPLAAERDIRIQTPSVEDCPWVVQADHQRLRQVLLNLASNAVKYNHHGGSIGFACQAAADGRVRILVHDTGPGIPADKLPRLFTPFDRLGAEQTDIQGTGMGLALSKRLTEAMGGTLTAHSVQGKGSTFTVELAQAEDPLERYQRQAPPRSIPRQDPSAGPERTVLYVEDNPSNLRLVERVLGERGGVRLVTATRGDAVQGLVRQHLPDLVLLDLHLPDLGGQEVLRRLRADPQTAHVPVVVVSADATAGQIQRLLAAGARQYLTKPLDVDRFLEVVDELLQAARR